MMAASGGVGLPKSREIGAESRDRQERIDCVPCVTERETGLLLGYGGVLLRVGIGESNTVGFARGAVGTGVDTVGAGKTPRDRGDRRSGGDGCHNIYDIRFGSIKSH